MTDPLELAEWFDTAVLSGSYYNYEQEKFRQAAQIIREQHAALDQLLDDMGAGGLCVCQAAKDQALSVLGRAAHEA